MNIKQFLIEVQRLQYNLMNCSIIISTNKDNNSFCEIKVIVTRKNKCTEVLVTSDNTESVINNKYNLIISTLNLID